MPRASIHAVGGITHVRYKSAVRMVLIAAKQLALAKTRLAQALPVSAERIALAEAMFRDVLSAGLSAGVPRAVAVVTSDTRLLQLARTAGAIAIDEQFPRGLNVAVRIATAALIERGATTVCTLLSDIPMVTGEDIDAVFEAMPRSGPGVVLVPSFDFSGTNMIARSPADAIPTRFGRLSLVRHLDGCRACGLQCKVVRLMRPAIDLDLPGDLIEFARSPSMTHTFSHLARLGMVHG
ncbi:MAG: 2-phospho-L-lactate guanylyltransferase [Candidatus Binataceae bacterium]